MDWLIQLGYWGLFIGTFLAGTVLPISSDILLVGVFTLGDSNPWLCLLAATSGNWIGLITTYSLGWLGKWEWLERWFNIKREKLIEQKKVVDKYGVWIALFTWIPVVGIVGLVGLGFYKVKPRLTILLLLLGCFARFLGWTLLYVRFGQQFIEWITR
ncbi:membrane protein YqaA with SNARE-associated domain [Parabacteroides sp. PF5-5]|uniref:YqaA family protein n=1 Tax=unclassified Parabacteroides TaxID=2649774 RepID=UPI0024763146|nr:MULTISPECIES: DedA family protein [unclassified Parabacteroides]MDH6303586.1 membrane protein YqaA with SNARE-associated domain [Parabacteroides sp. PH5-39]MDH6314908.1 membrane protein YqaA with SNARE-associated domain [Parabacteroides sp. PF5-13]MDH6318245.1 membrane protein YqaA with SNARE-associated domain [Parabacteroides sp. PH5-13]MDH6321822.1 membrane protein YqaA with SNARE-associated domain [Parabacteroides sp. PH5-8]MDH6325946.1 membrane protein YqaA with SNARE-associated domain 